MNVHEIRRRFLNFFRDHGHEVVASASLVPHDDPTLFFVNAGMVPFKDAFTGAARREVSRATSVQRCMRVSGKHNDLENVGRTPRHHTFFEMLGNFSFGDYFKREAIAYSWAFLTQELGISPDRLWVTVFEEDDEAYDLWLEIGFPKARLQRMGADENFWSMGDTGPCGPCSEIHYDHGPGVSNDTRGPAGGDDRYVEIWNLVFMQFEQRADGSRVPLPSPSIDTGAGLERLAAVMQGVFSNYDADVFQGLIGKGAELSGKPYGDEPEVDVALRVIADHARATTFLVSDGVMPSNEGRGYVLRRVMRRAIRFGVKIGLDRPFLHQMCARVVADFGSAYPELRERVAFIEEVVRAEEERFRTTLDRGLRLLEAEVDKLQPGEALSGQVAFTLSDTFGFPLDLTRLIAEEQGISVDEGGFEQALEAQRARGRAAWKGSGEEAVEGYWRQVADDVGATVFDGYPTSSRSGVEGQGRVLALARRRDHELEEVQALSSGESGVIVMDRTPFYAESGGQVGDVGRLVVDGAVFHVDDTTKASGLHLHHGRLIQGDVTVGHALRAMVEGPRRDATRRNHTGTHLLHAALREVLGDHVTQKGSLVGPDRLRFDFSHHKPMTEQELVAVEDRVNAQILRNVALTDEVMPLERAKAEGAMALFGEKYDDEVRVVRVPGFSTELCGGTHVLRTGDIGSFVILSEAGVAAGVRRLEAQTGQGALQVSRDRAAALREAAEALKAGADRVVESIRKLQDERRRLERELEQARAELARSAASDLLSHAREIGGVQVLVGRYDGDLKEQADRLRDKLGTSLVVLASTKGSKAILLVATTSDLAGKRVHAGHLVRDLAKHIGGGGGGRPDLAQAGGSQPEGLDSALQAAWAWAEAHLTGA
ncbi:MAG: alanine--tRNA ligase [Deltaproteobacteria bacterium]|nr:MAG: alanine--tRNA ligase [Deltaproteobacteria bacterium]